MPIYNIYSRRKRCVEKAEPDVYQYDQVPEKLRVQILHIWDSALGTAGYEIIREILRREHGKLYLARQDYNPYNDCRQYLLKAHDIDEWLDVIEISFRYITRVVSDMAGWQRDSEGIIQEPDDAIAELNFRFRDAGLGYQIENGEIIRVDSQFVHAEVVKPTLQFLSDRRFAGAQQEFLDAHAHYRNAEFEDAIVDALRAFESTLRAICDIKRWTYPQGARASDLIRIVRQNDLLPTYLDQTFDQLVATLQSGLPKVRNEAGGHGQGREVRSTPGYVAAYALHLAATDILLLAEAFKASEE